MDHLGPFLVQYGGIVLFVMVFAEQLGLPLPAVPLLLLAGAFAGAGKMNLVLAISLAVIAALLGDLVWYLLGRSRGSRILALLCRISLEPDSCVRTTEDLFIRYGMSSFLVAKFIPGVSTVMPPLAGVFGVRVPRFLLYATLGAFLYAGAYIGLGYLFSSHLERLAAQAVQLSSTLVVLLVGATAAYVGLKYLQRHRLFRRLRGARITPEELKQKLDAGEEVVIVDVRSPLQIEATSYGIPGALRMAMAEVEQRHREIPRDRDVVLYCT